MIKKIPLILLLSSIFSLIIAVTTLFIGSSESKIYNQMKDSRIITTLDDLQDQGNRPFLLYGYIESNHKTEYKNMVAYEKRSGTETIFATPQLNISLGDSRVKLKSDYGFADYNIKESSDNYEICGIKAGIDVTIYAVNYIKDDFTGVKGFKIYPGNPNQYINFLSSPYNSYMVFVRIFIGTALLLFLLSIAVNIKK